MDWAQIAFWVFYALLLVGIFLSCYRDEVVRILNEQHADEEGWHDEPIC
jgi:hypothetical protein